jgi:stage II sporulation protein D
MRGVARVFVVLALFGAMTLAAQPVGASDDFRFEGRGWGHGIGMAQYGALNQALEGRTYRQILAHYYRGTSVGTHRLAYDLYVGLLQRRTSVRFRPVNGALTLRHGDQTVQTGTSGEWQFRRVATNQCRFFNPAGTAVTNAGACNAEITWGNQPTTRVTVVERGRTYARGRLLLRSPGNFDGFHLVNRVNTEHYLYGLGEMGDSFHREALRAQAVAARSYAVYAALGLGAGESSGFVCARGSACWCHVFDSVQDQVFDGWNRESIAPNLKAAVDATRDQVVKHPDSRFTRSGVAQTFYYSSSGGRTENKEDVWGGVRFPYLVSVSDPWSLRSNNPLRSWPADFNPPWAGARTRISGSAIARKVGFDRVLSLAVVSRNVSGSARTIEIRGVKDGRSVATNYSAVAFRADFGLLSTHITRIFLPPFVDDDGLIYEQDIIWIAHRGIAKGCNPPANDRYCPHDAVTREQMAAFLVRAMRLTDANHPGFRDVPAGSTYDRDIRRLAKAGITKGCNPPANDRYCPKDAVTRGQMASFLARAFR